MQVCEFCGNNCEGYVCKKHDTVLEHELETIRTNLRREEIGFTMEENGLRPSSHQESNKAKRTLKTK